MKVIRLRKWQTFTIYTFIHLLSRDVLDGFVVVNVLYIRDLQKGGKPMQLMVGRIQITFRRIVYKWHYNLFQMNVRW